MKNKTYYVGIYVRLSNEDERSGESVSIENQKSLLTKYVKKQGWVLVETYCEMKISKMIQFENMNPPRKARYIGF